MRKRRSTSPIGTKTQKKIKSNATSLITIPIGAVITLMAMNTGFNALGINKDNAAQMQPITPSATTTRGPPCVIHPINGNTKKLSKPN